MRFAFVLSTIFIATFATGCAAHPQSNFNPAKQNSSAPGAGELAQDGERDDAELRPFESDADAMSDVDAALLMSKSTGRTPLLVLGGNWCHDSRSLAGKFADPALAPILEDNFHLVWVDVGHRDRNLDVAERFGVEEIIGTPTIIILSTDGGLLNQSSVHDWRNAASRSLEEVRDYLLSFTGAAQ